MRLGFTIGGYLQDAATPLSFVFRGYLYSEQGGGSTPSTPPAPPIFSGVQMDWMPPKSAKRNDDQELLMFLDAFMKIQTTRP